MIPLSFKEMSCKQRYHKEALKCWLPLKLDKELKIYLAICSSTSFLSSSSSLHNISHEVGGTLFFSMMGFVSIFFVIFASVIIDNGERLN
jgi:hypothetical protein